MVTFSTNVSTQTRAYLTGETPRFAKLHNTLDLIRFHGTNALKIATVGAFTGHLISNYTSYSQQALGCAIVGGAYTAIAPIVEASFKKLAPISAKKEGYLSNEYVQLLSKVCLSSTLTSLVLACLTPGQSPKDLLTNPMSALDPLIINVPLAITMSLFDSAYKRLQATPPPIQQPFYKLSNGNRISFIMANKVI